jgi:hypothetical protein
LWSLEFGASLSYLLFRKKRGREKSVRVTDAKEVGVENPAEETFCNPNRSDLP